MSTLAFDPDALREKYRAERDKRLRPDGNDQYVEVTGSSPTTSRTPTSSRSSATRSFDEVDVVVIGGGFGGLLAGARLKEAGITDVRIIEKGGDFGGTWYWNRYPGAQCDIESYIYLPLLEEIGYIPKEKYTRAPEILEHSRSIGRALRPLRRRAVPDRGHDGMTWDDDPRPLARGDEPRRRAAGPLRVHGERAAAPPEAARRSRASSPSAGTRSTPAGGTTTTRAATPRGASRGSPASGSGSSAPARRPCSACPTSAPPPSSSTCSSARRRRSTSATTGRPIRSGRPSLEPGWQQRRMENFNNLVSGISEPEDLVNDGWTDIIGKLLVQMRKADATDMSPGGLAKTVELADFEKMESIRARVDTIVNDPATAEALKPYYRQFCKRPCFHDEYLDTYNRPNVTLVDTDGRGVDRITERGVVVGETEYELDCLIYATGFEVGTDYTRRAGYEVVGRDGLTLTEKWKDGASTLHGMHTRGFPNLLIFSLQQSGFTVELPARPRRAEPPRRVHPAPRPRPRRRARSRCRQEAEDAWVATILELAQFNLDFLESCTPGYYNNEGKPSERGRPQRLLRRRFGGLLQGHRRLARRGLAARAGADHADSWTTRLQQIGRRSPRHQGAHLWSSEGHDVRALPVGQSEAGSPDARTNRWPRCSTTSPSGTSTPSASDRAGGVGRSARAGPPFRRGSRRAVGVDGPRADRPTVDAVPDGSFDLVHARLVLVDVPERVEALRAPGAGRAPGWLARGRGPRHRLPGGIDAGRVERAPLPVEPHPRRVADAPRTARRRLRARAQTAPAAP